MTDQPGQLIIGMYATADAEVVKAGNLCDTPVEWEPDPWGAPGVVRSGRCTFARDHGGDHSRP